MGTQTLVADSNDFCFTLDWSHFSVQSRLGHRAVYLHSLLKMVSFLKKIWDLWKKFALKFGEFMSGVFLTLFYFLIVTPHAILMKCFSDPLQLKSQPSWKPRKPESKTLEEYKHQF